MLDHAGGHREVQHLHGPVLMHHGIDQPGGEGVPSAHPVQDREGEQLALKGMPLIPHEGLQAVLRSGMGIPHVPRDAFQVRIPLREGLEDLILLLVAGLQRHSVLQVPLGRILRIPVQMIGLDSHQHVHIGQALRAVVPGFLPGPQGGAEVPVKGHRQPQLLRRLQHVQRQLRAVFPQRRGDAGKMQPGEILQQRLQIHPGKIIFRDGRVLPVIDHLAGPDPVSRLQIIGPQPVGGRLLRPGQDHGRAVVAPQRPHRALPQGVVRHHREEGGINPQVRQRQGDVRLRSPVAGLKAVGHPDLVIVRRGQPQHDFPHGDEPVRPFLSLQKRISVLHRFSLSAEAKLQQL